MVLCNCSCRIHETPQFSREKIDSEFRFPQDKVYWLSNYSLLPAVTISQKIKTIKRNLQRDLFQNVKSTSSTSWTKRLRKKQKNTHSTETILCWENASRFYGANPQCQLLQHQYIRINNPLCYFPSIQCEARKSKLTTLVMTSLNHFEKGVNHKKKRVFAV